MKLRLGLFLERGAKVLAFLLSAGLFAVSVWYVWNAVAVPLELEIREGTGWLLVLARRAGVDIYDSTRVAFVNMNHGPMDPLLKGWLGEQLPMLRGHVVIRCFVFLMPFFFLGSAYYVCRRKWTDALLAAAALYLLLADLTLMLVVGRSDATLLCAVTVGFTLTHALLVNRHRNWTNVRYIVLQVLFGSCSAVMFLTTWRVVPTIGIMLLLTLAKQVAESSYRFWRSVLGAVGLFAAGFALVWVPMFELELHGDFPLYFRHFFGFFSHDSGWGTFPGPSFRPFPVEIYQPRVGLLALMAGLVLAALYRLRRERAQLIVWLLALPIGWVVYSYAYYANQGGGGPHYYCAYFLTAWFLILHGLRRRSRWRPLGQIAIAGLLIWCYPWDSVIKRGHQFVELRAQSTEFLKKVAARTAGEPILGENSHLYKRKYQGEVVDCGDTVELINRSKYFGEDFTRTYERYLNELAVHPPRFVMVALFNPQDIADTATPRLTQILRERYRVAITGPQTFVANGGGGTVLYERRDD
jgi:hypothetical protein